ncbi:MAG TPA: hypothetical protein VK116_19090 [Planctomycetota bacterium]|nr:hypothetical protein [Planctomycetota bacterium]
MRATPDKLSARSGVIPYAPALGEGRRITRASILRAVDRPDRLELDWRDESVEESDGPAPGAPIELLVSEDEVFRGVIERVGELRDRTGWARRLVAWSEWDERRASIAREHFEVTDSELATRIALALGLKPAVEPTIDVHERISIEGDPLVFLRTRARAHGFELAVASGTLHFAGEIAGAGGRVERIVAGRDAMEIELEERVRGRYARVVVRGRPRFEPLGTVELSGFGGRRDGRFRVLRVRSRFAGGRFMSELDLLDIESGADLERFRRGSRP